VVSLSSEHVFSRKTYRNLTPIKTRISSTLLIRLRFKGYRSKSGIVRTLNCVYSTFKNGIFRLEQIFNKLMIDSEEGKVIDKFSL